MARELKFKVNDSVRSKEFGYGFVRKTVQDSPTGLNYFFKFRDGTSIWMGQKDGEKRVSLNEKTSVKVATPI